MTISGNSPVETPPRAVVVIPAYNEENAIGKVVREVRDMSALPVLVVDDSSEDSTVEQARLAGATVIPLAVRLGAWGATQTGFRYALRRGFDSAVTMDADGQHEARWIEALLKPVRDGRSDVVIGAFAERGSRMRQLGWQMMKRASGLSLPDITSGFRAYNRRSMKALARKPATLLEYQDIGVLLLLQNEGMAISSVSVEIQPRRLGRSRIFHSRLIIVYYMVHAVLLGISKRKLRRAKNQHRMEYPGT